MAHIVGAGFEIETLQEALTGHAIAQRTSAVRLQRGNDEILHDLDLAEPSSKGCKPADLDNIFISTNVEDATRGAPSREQKALNSANLDKALMRFEFLQVRLWLLLLLYTTAAIAGTYYDELLTMAMLV